MQSEPTAYYMEAVKCADVCNLKPVICNLCDMNAYDDDIDDDNDVESLLLMMMTMKLGRLKARVLVTMTMMMKRCLTVQYRSQNLWQTYI